MCLVYLRASCHYLATRCVLRACDLHCITHHFRPHLRHHILYSIQTFACISCFLLARPLLLSSGHLHSFRFPWAGYPSRLAPNLDASRHFSDSRLPIARAASFSAALSAVSLRFFRCIFCSPERGLRAPRPKSQRSGTPAQAQAQSFFASPFQLQMTCKLDNCRRMA